MTDTATVHLTAMITVLELDAMVDWLNSYTSSQYEFIGQGMGILRFDNVEDAVAFKLRFGLTE